MARLFTPVRLVAAGLVLLTVVAVLYVAPSDRYIFLPDRARAVAPLVDVQGEKPDRDGGGIYYVAVDVRKASWLERLVPGIRDGSTLVPVSAVRAPGESDVAHRRAELRSMARSQEVAAAVALRALGYHVVVRSNGTLVAGVAPDGPSRGKLQPEDVIVGVNGAPVRSPAELRRVLSKYGPGVTVRLAVRRGDRLRQIPVRTIADPRTPGRAIIGILVEEAAEIELPLSVRIDLGQVGGPSAGLAFALDVAEELGHDVDHGQKIAATGELRLDGSVGAVGGIKQKTIGAREAGAEIFVVPAGDNAAEARRYAGNMRILPVHSFRQALRALATPRIES
ncbi:MAG TPA: PDZ domain-containing protein [Gaiellaceae bacterium]|nr:PDZ domain-containing protein [Gaiellaceae bacterium]